jgi:hypothetical protein
VAAQRFLWNNAPRFGIYRVNWNIIRQDTFVTITAAEARLGPAGLTDSLVARARSWSVVSPRKMVSWSSPCGGA